MYLANRPSTGEHTHTIDAKASTTGARVVPGVCSVNKAGAVRRRPTATRRGARARTRSLSSRTMPCAAWRRRLWRRTNKPLNQCWVGTQRAAMDLYAISGQACSALPAPAPSSSPQSAPPSRARPARTQPRTPTGPPPARPAPRASALG